jgi:hypothetical protein
MKTGGAASTAPLTRCNGSKTGLQERYGQHSQIRTVPKRLHCFVRDPPARRNAASVLVLECLYNLNLKFVIF